MVGRKLGKVEHEFVRKECVCLCVRVRVGEKDGGVVPDMCERKYVQMMKVMVHKCVIVVVFIFLSYETA